MHTLTGALASLVVGIAAALVIVAIAILPFLTPVWVSFEQGRAQAAAWTGFSDADLRTATDAILADLVIGPPEFDVALNGVPVLNERERSTCATCAACSRRSTGSRSSGRSCSWRRSCSRGVARPAPACGDGSAWPAGSSPWAPSRSGSSALMFFDTAFEVFHELFFPAGSFLFDPRTDRLVQLFPESFWVESTIAVGIVIIALVARCSRGWRRGGQASSRRGTTRRAQRQSRRPRPRPGADRRRWRRSRSPAILGIEIRISLAWVVLIALIAVIGAQQAILGSTRRSRRSPSWVIGIAVALLFLVSVDRPRARPCAGRAAARRADDRRSCSGFIGGLAPLSIQAPRPHGTSW